MADPVSYISGVNAGGISFYELLKSPRVQILYIGAHVHSTNNDTSVHDAARRHGWREFCVGGGGGWACDGPQGFVVGEVRSDGRVDNVRIKLISNALCCRQNPQAGR